MILVDTDPLVAAANRNDTHHIAHPRKRSRRPPPPRLVPGIAHMAGQISAAIDLLVVGGEFFDGGGDVLGFWEGEGVLVLVFDDGVA
jgi:hypothetical protein